MKVLSLFDGIGTGRLSLERAGINVDKYYASEIDKNAITIAKTNYSDIIELGSVLNWRNWDIEWNTIDLLIGGSPCTSFSSAGKQQGFNGESKLFFEYRDILNYLKSINPNIKFLLENVIMKVDSTTIKTTSISIIIINNTDNEIGYPNDEYGVCTDVVAFGLKGAGYDLMNLVNEHIKSNRNLYDIDVIDKNIDFRRVQNLKVYLDNNAIVLTKDINKIKEWQGGDIVVFKNHIGIVSDKRNKKGISFIIHHANPYQRYYEEDILEYRNDIIGHYRIS